MFGFLIFSSSLMLNSFTLTGVDLDVEDVKKDIFF